MANGGSSPNWSYGFTPTAAQWNAAFAGKMDYNGTNNIFIVPFTFSGNSTALAASHQNHSETFATQSAAPGSLINLLVANGQTLYCTANATANFTLNVSMSGGNTLAAALQVGQRITCELWLTCGATPFYLTALQIDSAPVTITWVGNTAPSAGFANILNRYTFVIARTGASTYTVLGKLEQG